MEKIFLTEHIHDDAVAYLKEHFEVVQGTSVEPAEIIHQAQGCAGILIRSAKITAEIMDAIPTLKVVAKHGMGVDNIDVAHATEKGILVVNAPYSNMNAVAEHIVTLLLALISVILMIVLFDPQQDASRVYYGTDTRAFSLLFGALLAILWDYRMVPRRLSASVNMVLGSVSFAVLLVMTIAINGSSNFWYRGGQFVGTILTVLVIYTVLGRKTLLSRFLSNPVLKWIGDRSYSIYLWHYPIILLISKGIKASWWITLIEIVLSVVLAELSYRFIETPIRHGIIGEYLNILRSRPKSRQEKKRQIQVARRSLKVMAGTFVLTVSLILCMVFVPKKNALDTLQKREAKAKETGKMTEEQLAKQKANGSESDDTICTADLTDDEILEGLNLLLIGDSIAVDVTDDFYEIFPNSVSDTKIGRITSLGKQVLDSYIDEKKWKGEGVIFASLSNSPINGELEDIREKIGKDMPLFLTTVRIPHDTFEEESNSKIKKFVEENDHTYLIDWYAASEGHDEYFDADDTHLLPAGAKAYAKCIKEAVLSAYKKENIEIPKSRLSSGKDKRM